MPPKDASVTTFLHQVESLLKTGSATELSYRPALVALFDAVMAPAEAINEPKHEQYGAPDFVIQQQNVPLGHVEVKDIGIALDHVIGDSERADPKTTNGKQLKRYRAALPNLLYTDGLEWHWFVDGKLRQMLPVMVAKWDLRTKTLQRASDAEAQLTSLLQQFTNHDALTISTPKDLAQRLAQIARWLDDLIGQVFQEQGNEGSLHQQLAAFRKTLLPNLTPDEFADMYAQTLVYGLFAARVAHPNGTDFSLQAAGNFIPKTNPFLRTLFRQIADDELDERIAWLVEDCARLLAHTDMATVMEHFGHATRQEDPVVHFYEDFLAAYDPKMRESRGVYYTPEPVVSYIVRSVDALLRSHFDKPAGLADEQTLILDPATGTGTFLHTVVQQIHAELADQGLAGTWNSYVPTKLLPRLFGFELLMAPYTMAHLKLGLLLQEFGYTFGSKERLGVYLTNTLEGVPDDQQLAFTFARAIADEGKAATKIKRDQPVMVVLGNPPYSGHSANKGIWIRELVEDYKKGYPELYKPAQAKWLQDDYVKFIRFGQWRIERTGEGVLAFISNNGYVDNPTFRGMRRSLLNSFDTIYILNLHGNSNRQERAPDGGPDENVFDIRQGVTIGLFVKRADSGHGPASVYYADLWGKREGKYKVLAVEDVMTTSWQLLSPTSPSYLFTPQVVDARLEYEHGWNIKNVMDQNGDPAPGIVTTQDQFAISLTADEAKHKVEQLLGTHTEEEARQLFRLCSQEQWSYARAKAELATGEWHSQLQLILYRPFDIRWTVYNPNVAVHRRERVMRHMLAGQNVALATTRSIEIGAGFEHVLCTDSLIQHHTVSIKEVNYLFPLYLYPAPGSLLHNEEGTGPDGRRPNLSPTFIADLEQRLSLSFVPDGRGDLTTTAGPEDVFHYAYAVFHSPTYRERYAEFLKIDFPRLPITRDREQFTKLAAQGAALVDLHLLRLPGSKGVGGAGGSELLRTPGRQGVNYPMLGTDVIEKVQYKEPLDGAPGYVLINATQRFNGIEPETWMTQIGGYQPLEKWLKDRRGRKLTVDDISHYMRMVIALRETRRIMAAIDELIPAWPLGLEE